MMIAALLSCSLLAGQDPTAEPSKPAVDAIEILERAAAANPKPSDEEIDSMCFAFYEHPAVFGPVLLKRIQAAELTENELVYYLWGLTLSPWPPAVEKLVEIAQPGAPAPVCGNAVAALAATREEAAGKHLLHLLDESEGEDARYNLLSHLAEMQYAPALPQTAEILEKGSDEYWQPIFVFGKYGDVAVPFLLERLRDEKVTKNAKNNALMVLGHWLMPPEAAPALKKLLDAEEDQETRMMILSALSTTVGNLDEQEAFYAKLIAGEADGEVKEFAEMILGQISGIREDFAKRVEDWKPDAEVFAKEYRLLFLSSGLDGDIERLGRASTPGDEPALKRLRERILMRDSDECWYDYAEVNLIIMIHRWLPAEDD